jgi:protein phosphatase PTC7
MSTAQQHEFNTPFQLSKIPPRMLRQMQLFGAVNFADMPVDADIYSHSVAHGDVFVLATDGVWDNLGPEDVLDVVCSAMVRSRGWVLGDGGGVQISDSLVDIAQNCVGKGGKDEAVAAVVSEVGPMLSSVLASTIVKEAKEASVNMKRESPFGKAVKRAYPQEDWRGGKVDDICVVVGLVLQDSS